MVVVLERLDFPRSQTDVAPSCKKKGKKKPKTHFNDLRLNITTNVRRWRSCLPDRSLPGRKSPGLSTKRAPHPGKTSPVLQQRVN